MAKCPVCKQYLAGFNWTKTKNGKNWLKNTSGEWHDCPKNQKQYSGDLTYNPTPIPHFIFCGKCTHLCKDEWCSQCDMYPQVTYHGNTMTDNLWFSPNPTVEASQDTNRSQIMEEFRMKYDSPCNGLQMNKDGTMPAGYKLTPELIKWYNEEGGKSILEELYSKIWYKKRERISE